MSLLTTKFYIPPTRSELVPRPRLIEQLNNGLSRQLILDDYHVIESKPVGQAFTYLLDHLPVNMQLVIAIRVDPPLPLARLRARGQMTELRIADLRFTPEEVALFFNQVMDLGLSAEDIDALETRTEGWVVGLQLAALSLQEKENASEFIQTFTGSHHHILD
jgi:LuxR family maltose regulon positive regulatory protein